MYLELDCPKCNKDFEAPLDYIDDLCDIAVVGVNATCPHCSAELTVAVTLLLDDTVLVE